MRAREEMLGKIRSLSEETADIRLSKTEVNIRRKSVKFYFISSKAVGEETKDKILAVVNEYVPDGFLGVETEVIKTVADEELVSMAIKEYLSENQSAIAPYIDTDDLKVEIGEGKVRYTLNVNGHVASYFAQNNLVEKIDGFLGRRFCDDFTGEVADGKAEEEYSRGKEESFVPEKMIIRSIFIKEVMPIDDKNMSSNALYMADASRPSQGVVLAGRVTGISERETKNGKPFFVISFTDTTGTVEGRYFSKKATLEKVRKIKEGDGIITEGSFEYYKNSLNYTIRNINCCKFPEDFVPEEAKEKEPPANYTKVKPKRVIKEEQEFLFGVEKKNSDCLKGVTFAVFDLETTGTDPSSDAITEIGAVKIEDGKITESFHTLINPGRSISERITELTGIDDEMVKDAPTFKEVLPDFYKFTYGAVLVGHNVEFDYRFIKNNSKKEGYNFYNPAMDTLSLSRELLPELANHKLNTVAEHFGIGFNHHRALSDAEATAELFIELINMKKCLPKV